MLSALALVVLIRAAQPGPFLAFGAPDHFPADVAVTTLPTVNIYGDRPDLRVLQLVDRLNAMWAQAFRDAGDDYEEPIVDTSDGPPAAGCGSTATGWAGIYCPRDESIVIDLGSQEVKRAVLGEAGADASLGYVLAHEIGHHVQALRGSVHATQEQIVKVELHAECLAGLWGRAAGQPPPPDWTFQSDADHGTAAQQRHWLLVGHRSGRPADCDRVFD